MDLLHSFLLFNFFGNENLIFIYFLKLTSNITVCTYQSQTPSLSLCFLNGHVYGFSFTYIENLFNQSSIGGHFGHL